MMCTCIHTTSQAKSWMPKLPSWNAELPFWNAEDLILTSPKRIWNTVHCKKNYSGVYLSISPIPNNIIKVPSWTEEGWRLQLNKHVFRSLCEKTLWENYTSLFPPPSNFGNIEFTGNFVPAKNRKERLMFHRKRICDGDMQQFQWCDCQPSTNEGKDLSLLFYSHEHRINKLWRVQ